MFRGVDLWMETKMPDEHRPLPTQVTSYTVPVVLDPHQYERLCREADRRGTDVASALAAVCSTLSGQQWYPARPSFEEARQQAYGSLGDAADWLRAGDFRGDPPGMDHTRRKRLLTEFFDTLGETKSCLDELARNEQEEGR